MLISLVLMSFSLFSTLVFSFALSICVGFFFFLFFKKILKNCVVSYHTTMQTNHNYMYIASPHPPQFLLQIIWDEPGNPYTVDL